MGLRSIAIGVEAFTLGDRTVAIGVETIAVDDPTVAVVDLHTLYGSPLLIERRPGVSDGARPRGA